LCQQSSATKPAYLAVIMCSRILQRLWRLWCCMLF
jgi:hypothetical protein